MTKKEIYEDGAKRMLDIAQQLENLKQKFDPDDKYTKVINSNLEVCIAHLKFGHDLTQALKGENR